MFFGGVSSVGAASGLLVYCVAFMDPPKLSTLGFCAIPSVIIGNMDRLHLTLFITSDDKNGSSNAGEGLAVLAVIALLPLAILAVAFACARRRTRRRTPPPPPPPPRTRAMSFSSGAMAMGGFPSKANMPPSVISTAIYFNELPERTAVCGLIRDVLLRYDRFRSVPVEIDGVSCWREVEEVDVDRHVVCAAVASGEELHAYIERAIVAPLRNKREDAPLFEFHLVEAAVGAGPSCLLARVDHCIGDGISLVQAFCDIVRGLDGEALPSLVPYSRTTDGSSKSPRRSLGLVTKVLKCLRTALTLASSRFDSDLAFTSRDKANLRFSGKRRVVIFPTMDLVHVKQIKRAAGVTVNDVVFSCTTGAIRRYCQARGDAGCDAAEALVRALLPVAFPRTREQCADPARSMRNLWCFVSAEAPVREKDARSRLRATHAVTKQLKDSPMAVVQLRLQDALLSKMPMFATRKAAYDTFVRHSLVFSNVPGPQVPVTIAGREVVGLQMLFPNLITQVGLLSFNGKVFMNMCVDAEVVEEPETLADFYREEMKELAEAFGVTAPAETTSLAERAQSRNNGGTKSSNASSSWKESAGRSGGKEGYQFGDIARTVISKMK